MRCAGIPAYDVQRVKVTHRLRHTKGLFPVDNTNQYGHSYHTYEVCWESVWTQMKDNVRWRTQVDCLICNAFFPDSGARLHLSHRPEGSLETYKIEAQTSLSHRPEGSQRAYKTGAQRSLSYTSEDSLERTRLELNLLSHTEDSLETYKTGSQTSISQRSEGSLDTYKTGELLSQTDQRTVWEHTRLELNLLSPTDQRAVGK